MTGIQRDTGMTHSTNSTTLGDLLERILDKGVVVAGDIRIKIVDIELLTIEIRLLICSVDRAEQIGMDWWRNEGKFPGSAREDAVTRLDTRLDRLEALLMEGRERPIVRPDDE
ncbi:hypothetical protein GCM10011363_44900 [Marivita lacus]|uniref:Gas vesicle structural protein n=2 Tax=Marivita lacus TaxID=1323742 RepID=A0ABQ1LGJ1_9RHOB|nr:hypothetical protein GCM10011363_44900 [Marivita lacus]